MGDNSVSLSNDGENEEENAHDRTERIRKKKNIRKERVRARRELLVQEEIPKQDLTRQEKKQIQKEKNRVAAQVSRDRQKRHVQELQNKIQELEERLSQQLCRKCQAELSDPLTGEQGQEIEKMGEIEPLGRQPGGILIEEPSVEDLPFMRVPLQANDFGFGKIGSLFCIAFLLIAVLGVNETTNLSSTQIATVQSPDRRILHTSNSFCSAEDQKQGERISLNLSRSYRLSSEEQDDEWPFNLGEEQSQCKNDFWKSYLEKVREEKTHSITKTLAVCSSPHLIHLSTQNNSAANQTDDTWTFVISDPEITHAHLADNGQFLIDEVNFLSGFYQMVGEKVILKKVIGQNCLA